MYPWLILSVIYSGLKVSPKYVHLIASSLFWQAYLPDIEAKQWWGQAALCVGLQLPKAYPSQVLFATNQGQPPAKI